MRSRPTCGRATPSITGRKIRNVLPRFGSLSTFDAEAIMNVKDLWIRQG